MSRIGKKPVHLPDKVQVIIKDSTVQVNGPKGSLERKVHPDVDIKIEDNVIKVTTNDPNNKKKVALQGLFRALIANMVTGVSTGYEKSLLLSGIGYRSEIKNDNTVVLNVGYSNPVEFVLPQGISAVVENNTKIILTGINKESLGQAAANIRDVRPPEPYKGKGIMYADERIIRKAGKTAGKD